MFECPHYFDELRYDVYKFTLFFTLIYVAICCNNLLLRLTAKKLYSRTLTLDLVVDGGNLVRTDHISYHDSHLDIDSPTLTRSLPQSEVKQIYICHMQDEIHHGDESFHILHLGGEFLLVGPFVDGGIGAIDALISNCPCIPITHYLVGSIPYRFRQKGLLGIQFFPIPGLFFGPISDLKHFHLLVHGE